MTTVSRPDAILIAGPNGAGKTTFARQVLLLRYPEAEFLNADEIQREGSSLAHPMAAGRELVRRLSVLEDRRASFAVETTLSSSVLFGKSRVHRERRGACPARRSDTGIEGLCRGRPTLRGAMQRRSNAMELFKRDTRIYVRRLRSWRSRGYQTTLHFVELPSAEFAVRRVAGRVAAGGHGVPEVDIRRRFERGLRLFETVYKVLPDRWYHWRSDDRGLELVDQSRGSTT